MKRRKKGTSGGKDSNSDIKKLKTEMNTGVTHAPENDGNANANSNKVTKDKNLVNEGKATTKRENQNVAKSENKSVSTPGKMKNTNDKSTVKTITKVEAIKSPVKVSLDLPTIDEFVENTCSAEVKPLSAFINVTNESSKSGNAIAEGNGMERANNLESKSVTSKEFYIDPSSNIKGKKVKQHDHAQSSIVKDKNKRNKW